MIRYSICRHVYSSRIYQCTRYVQHTVIIMTCICGAFPWFRGRVRPRGPLPVRATVRPMALGGGGMRAGRRYGVRVLISRAFMNVGPGLLGWFDLYDELDWFALGFTGFFRQYLGNLCTRSRLHTGALW